MFKRSAIWVLLCICVVVPGAVGAQDDPLITYLNAVAEMNRPYFFADPADISAAESPAGSALEWLQSNRVAYAERLEILGGLTPTAEVQAIHNRYIAVLTTAVDAIDRVLALVVPTDAEETAPAYMYRTPEFGYAFYDENAVICDLKLIATEVGVDDFPSLLCERNVMIEITSGVTVGSPDAPVNEIDIVHEAGCGGLCPGISYSVNTIYARAGEPISITFDNRNPLPFLFNLAIYRGYTQDERLRAENLIVSTYAGGPRVHQVTLTLEPGEYTYADNVHPGLMIGRLIVVD